MGIPVLEVHQVSISYPMALGSARSKNQTVQDVSLNIYPKETYGLLGFSGSGKTTLARAVARLLPISTGKILVDGKIWSAAMPTPRLGEGGVAVSMVFQDSTGSLNPRMPIGASIEEPLRFGGRQSPRDRRREVARILDRVGLSAVDARRFPHEFSGGQRQRIAIARALINRPKLIICDEPVSALDLSIQAQIVSLLAEIQQETSVSYLFITHNIELAGLICGRIGIMERGQLVEEGDTATIFRNARHDATRQLLTSCLSISTEGAPYRQYSHNGIDLSRIYRSED